MKYSLNILLTLVVVNFGFSQKTNSCVAVIKEYNNQFSNLSRPDGKEIYLIDYSTEFQYWDRSMTAEKIHTKMYVGKKYMHYLSNFVDIFSDEDYIATVLKREGKIVFTRNPHETNPFDNYRLLAEVKNILLDSSEILKCSVSESGRGELILNTSKLKIRNLSIQKLTYQYDHKSGELLKTITDYAENYQLKKMIVTNHAFDLKTTYRGFKPVRDIFFTKTGDLVSKYKDYEIVVD